MVLIKGSMALRASAGRSKRGFTYKRLVKVGFLSVTSALLWVCLGTIRAQSLPSSVCNVPIRESVAHILETVEHEFGKPVVCEITDSTGDYGNSNAIVLSLGPRPTVRGDGSKLGIPVIVLNKSPWRTDSEILHELFHLDLIAHGFPADIGIRAIPPGTDRTSLATVGPILKEGIEHHIFYPRMRSMGFDPDRIYRDELETALSASNISGWNQNPMLRSVHYAYAAVTIADARFMRDVDAAYRMKGWGNNLAVGRRLKDAVLSTKLTTGDGEAKALITCLNILFDNQFPMRWSFEGPTLYLGTSSPSAAPHR